VGSFYTSHTLRGPSQAEVLAFLSDRPAYVVEDSRHVIVLDKECESQDGKALANLAARLSSNFHCPVLAVLNHDDDILYFELYEDGEKTDEYNSNPGYFEDEGDDDGPRGGDASRLAAVFDVPDADRIESVLRNTDYVFAMQRHRDLVSALSLPAFAAGIGYNYAAAGDLPPGTTEAMFAHTGA